MFVTVSISGLKRFQCSCMFVLLRACKISSMVVHFVQMPCDEVEGRFVVAESLFDAERCAIGVITK